ncbi:hypothetical protein T261_07139 [Streptomyces lydicus]|nr:hypothetical protein T261_07139 [Streptomyces lydicus]
MTCDPVRLLGQSVPLSIVVIHRRDPPDNCRSPCRSDKHIACT